MLVHRKNYDFRGHIFQLSKNEPNSFNFIHFLAKFRHPSLIKEFDFQRHTSPSYLLDHCNRDERVSFTSCISYFIHVFMHFCPILFRGVGWGFLIPSKKNYSLNIILKIYKLYEVLFLVQQSFILTSSMKQILP